MTLVIVTRPPEQARSLTRALLSQGLKVLQFPLITIEALLTKPLDLSPQLIIFTSRNAVLHGRALLSHYKNIPIAAIGQGTRDELLTQGLGCDIAPLAPPYKSEALLPLLNNFRQKCILIIKGEGGRPWLANALKTEGCSVHELSVYRRVCPNYSAGNLRPLLKPSVILIISSIESLHNFHDLLTQNSSQTEISSLQCLVTSERIALRAKELGFMHTAVAESARDEDIIATLKRMTHER